MSLERYMSGGVKIRCSNCGRVVKDGVRYLRKKPYCRDCFGKRLGRKKEKDSKEVIP